MKRLTSWKPWLTSSALASAFALATLSATAVAQPGPPEDDSDVPIPDCPPGAICEEAEVAPPEKKGHQSEAEATVPLPEPEDGSTTVVVPPPKRGSDPNAARWILVRPGKDGQPQQVIVYEDGDAPPHAPGARVVRKKTVRKVTKRHHEHKRKKRWRRHRRWGMNLHIDGIILPRYRDEVEDVGMAGLGLSLKYRPIPHLALGFGADFLGGSDSNGYERQEIPLSLTATVYFNPRSLAQVYMFAGVNWSFARVFSDEFQHHLAEGTADEYNYFGGHGGLGLEFRVTRLIGLNIDGLAFVRSRTDSDEEGQYPEFYDPETGEASNTSVAGMVRGGVTFWW